jgi:hypothetical protein
MRITESKLRRVIREIIKESIQYTDDTLSDQNKLIWQENARARGYEFNSKVFKIERDCGSSVVKPGDYVLILTDGRGNDKTVLIEDEPELYRNLSRLIESTRFQFFCKHDFDLSKIKNTEMDVSLVQCGQMVSECNGNRFAEWLERDDYWYGRKNDWQAGVFTF